MKVEKNKAVHMGHQNRHKKSNFEQVYEGEEIAMEQVGKLMFRGEYVLINKDRDK